MLGGSQLEERKKNRGKRKSSKSQISRGGDLSEPTRELGAVSLALKLF